MENQDLTETKTLPIMREPKKRSFGKLRRVYTFARQYMSENTNLPYHNFKHAKDVGHAVLQLAKEYSYGGEARMVLATAALLHDSYFSVTGKDNEEISAQLAKAVLPKFGYEKHQVEAVSRLIMATKMPTNPKGHLEQIICDADVANLGRPDAIMKGYLLMQERGMKDYNKWHAGQYAFILGHKYYTAAARALWGKGKEQNLRFVAALL